MTTTIQIPSTSNTFRNGLGGLFIVPSIDAFWKSPGGEYCKELREWCAEQGINATIEPDFKEATINIPTFSGGVPTVGPAQNIESVMFAVRQFTCAFESDDDAALFKLRWL